MTQKLIGQDLFCSITEHSWIKYNINHRHTVHITAEEYCRILFGQYNFELFKLLKKTVVIADGQIYSAHYQSSDLCVHALNGDLLERKINFFEGQTPYDMAFDVAGQHIWVATGAGQVVCAKKLSSASVDFQIGTAYIDEGELSYPEALVIFDEDLYIVEMGNRRILKMNLARKERCIYLEFSEPVWGFQKNIFAEIIFLESGAYQLIGGRLLKLVL